MTTDPTTLRDRIADVLADADGWTWATDFDQHRSPAYQAYLERADKVLAALSGQSSPVGDSGVRDDVLRALDFPLCQTLGYTTPEGLLAAYDTTMRAAVRLEAADMAERLMDERYGPDCSYALGGNDVARELRRLAAGAQQPEPETSSAPREWCKCPSCWGWFVEEHPGEDLDELGRDLGWWSGLPEHRDAPAGAQQQPTTETRETVHGCPPDGSGLTPCCGRTPFELPLRDRISSEAPITCTGPAVSPVEAAEQLAARHHADGWDQRAQGAQDVADLLRAGEREEQPRG